MSSIQASKVMGEEVTVIGMRTTQRNPSTLRRLERLRSRVKKVHESAEAREAYIYRGESELNPEDISSGSGCDIDYMEYMPGIDSDSDSPSEKLVFLSDSEEEYTSEVPFYLYEGDEEYDPVIGPCMDFPRVICSREPIAAEDESRCHPKQDDPGVFMVDVSLEGTPMGLALIDSGSSLNIFPKSLCDRNMILVPTCTPLKVRLADTTRVVMSGMMKNMIIGVGRLRFKVDIVVMEIEENPHYPIILGRPFMNTSHSNLCMSRHDMKLYDAKGSSTHKIRKPEFPVPASIQVIGVVSADGIVSDPKLESLEDARVVRKNNEEEFVSILTREKQNRSQSTESATVSMLLVDEAKAVGEKEDLEAKDDLAVPSPKDRRTKIKKRARRVQAKKPLLDLKITERVGASIDGRSDCLFLGCTSQGKALVVKDGKTISVKASRVQTWNVKGKEKLE